MTYEFTNDWFDANARSTWDNHLFATFVPRKILEIGSYEGASACYLIEKFGKEEDGVEIHCIDTWAGGEDNTSQGDDMPAVEERFDRNMTNATHSPKVDVFKIKAMSDVALSRLMADGHAGTFDFVYVDGSHQAQDVLSDAVLAYQLVRPGGVIAFDDYLWNAYTTYGKDPLRAPKVAIDTFTNVFARSTEVLSYPSLSQLYVRKNQ